MIGLIGLFALFKAVVDYFPEKETLLKWCIFFYPSILFWSSGVLKEPILLFSLGFIILSLLNITNNKSSYKDFFILVIALLVLFYIKFYILFAFLPLLIPFFINKKRKIKFQIISYLISIIVFTAIGISIELIFPSIDLLDLLDKKQQSFITMAEFQGAGSYFEITNIEPNIFSIINAIPEGILNCFVRPLPWNVSSLIQIPPIIENLTIIMLLSISLYHIMYLKSFKKITSTNFILLCIFFTLLTFIIIGITTPISGTLVRYKVPALPFLTLIILMLINTNSLKKIRIK